MILVALFFQAPLHISDPWISAGNLACFQLRWCYSCSGLAVASVVLAVGGLCVSYRCLPAPTGWGRTAGRCQHTYVPIFGDVRRYCWLRAFGSVRLSWPCRLSCSCRLSCLLHYSCVCSLVCCWAGAYCCCFLLRISYFTSLHHCPNLVKS